MTSWSCGCRRCTWCASSRSAARSSRTSARRRKRQGGVRSGTGRPSPRRLPPAAHPGAPALPAVPGLEPACHYKTASPQEVGGDFYDVFPVGGGRWAFFLGDVCGKGTEAASVTSLTRYTLRAAAVDEGCGPQPSSTPNPRPRCKP
ncbi:PP2C family protein-serine/threonine phosphatase [Streptomyces globisporus]|uniref:PP2C family protein-serine/threonine phosphatase n=1 Tax=Streptomyces globisporus TaxID=1908 RepID=UPI0037B58994